VINVPNKAEEQEEAKFGTQLVNEVQRNDLCFYLPHQLEIDRKSHHSQDTFKGGKRKVI
jgi:hypothetical protein